MSLQIDVDPIKCEAHGLCAELLPERIALDEWGYPLIDPTPIPASLEGLARRTVNACPTLALRLHAAERVAERDPGGARRAAPRRA
ncbi:MAG: ferredoxin [Solirubrobacteraceae bacterium]